MTTAIWALVGFATWTVALLLMTVGTYRWSRILTGRQEIRTFRADRVEGADWYQRSMRAHANCVENLPVFAVIVFALYVADIDSSPVRWLAGTVLAARILQSLVHVSLQQTNRVVAWRFTFFLVQILAFLSLIAIIVMQA